MSLDSKNLSFEEEEFNWRADYWYWVMQTKINEQMKSVMLVINTKIPVNAVMYHSIIRPSKPIKVVKNDVIFNKNNNQ